MAALIVKSVPWLGLLTLFRQACGISLRANGVPKEWCIDEDMCVIPELQHTSREKVALQPMKKSGSDILPGCPANISHETRSLLFLLVPPFHGSTALQGTLMSSTQLSTLCPHGDWACEGNNIMADHGFEIDSVKNWDFETMLTLYSGVWDLQKPVFLEKNPVQIMEFETADVGVRDASLPTGLRDLGVKKLGLIYIVMWRPYCLSKLSKEFLKNPDQKKMEALEITYLKQQVDAHKYLTGQGEPVLVVNFADLIWQSTYTEERLNKFVPCLGTVDLDYLPVLGKDIFEGNGWKAQGTPREFGAAVEPKECCDYDLKTNSCHGSLPSEHLDEYKKYTDYLASHS